MVEFKGGTKPNFEARTLGASSTRTQLERMWEKNFDPEALGVEHFHPTETARFIAEQARKMRLAAMKSGHTRMVWMIENLYYEAYTLGSARDREDRAPRGAPCSKGN